MQKKNFHLVSLGCAKNTVDSESMAQLLARAGFQSTEKAEAASVLIVNTCGFIEAAKEESYQVLSELADTKKAEQVLIAAGCLTQRYGAEVAARVPGIDGILGTRRWMDIVEVVSQLREGSHPEPLYHLPSTETVGADERGTLRAANYGASAYLKIADGCRRPCGFCAIPLIKGSLVSRPMQAILSEARHLRDNGVREIILIAQDSTDYGRDQGMRGGLATLLEELVRTVPEVDWLRVLYNFPGWVNDRQIEVMAGHEQILPYLDIPLQHAHPDTLRRMRRPANVDWVHDTIAKMRSAMPELALRTTFIVGYPGETEAEFQRLLDFVEEMRFDRVGTFTFSFEAGTSSEPLGDPIPEEVKQERKDRLMRLQQQISLEKNQAHIGNTLDVLIEGHGEVEGSGEAIALGRSYRDAPEIDGMVIIDGKPPVGQIVPVQINGAMTYDLTGVVETSLATIAVDRITTLNQY